jgi:hypothetical protein
MTDTPEPTYVDRTATCHTEGCANADLAIPLQVPDEPDPTVVCGVCGQPVTDLT